MRMLNRLEELEVSRSMIQTCLHDKTLHIKESSDSLTFPDYNVDTHMTYHEICVTRAFDVPRLVL